MHHCSLRICTCNVFFLFARLVSLGFGLSCFIAVLPGLDCASGSLHDPLFCAFPWPSALGSNALSKAQHMWSKLLCPRSDKPTKHSLFLPVCARGGVEQIHSHGQWAICMLNCAVVCEFAFSILSEVGDLLADLTGEIKLPSQVIVDFASDSEDSGKKTSEPKFGEIFFHDFLEGQCFILNNTFDRHIPSPLQVNACAEADTFVLTIVTFFPWHTPHLLQATFCWFL